ncbi:MAG TPA: Na+/H+ antiporter [Legionellales bacterium]|nr:Na+/H+ antiporter [Legionellales bacterium]
MTAKLGLPLRMWHILQGEALLNDASGLVSFKFAVAALFSGLFSIQDAFLSLILISAGGILIGVLLSYGFVWILGRLSLHRFEETTIENLLLILLPYSAYLAAEFFHSSGILAAVAAGFTIDKVGFLDRTMVNMRIEGRFVWGMLELTLNGIIFVLLGIYLPNTMHLIDEIGISFSLGFTIVGIITFSLIFLRFIWVSLMLPLDKLFTSKKTKVWQLPDFTLLLAMSFGGIRGAIALAAILSLPNFISSGIAFPARDLLIIIVVGVVLCSLILSTIVLKIVLPRLKITTSSNPLDEENTARIAAAQAGIKAVERKMSAIIKDLNESEAAVCQQVGNALMASLNLFIVSAVGEEAEKNTSLQALTYEEKLRLSALDAARHELRKLKRQGKINNTTMINMMHRLDLRQFSLMDENKIYPRKHD